MRKFSLCLRTVQPIEQSKVLCYLEMRRAKKPQSKFTAQTNSVQFYKSRILLLPLYFTEKGVILALGCDLVTRIASDRSNMISQIKASEVVTTSPPVVFAGHNTYLMSVTRLCRDQDDFTDVVFQCSDGQLTAHRLVVASASKFLCDLLLEHVSEDETPVIILPEVSKSNLNILLDFIYSVTDFELIFNTFVIGADGVLCKINS